jgi:hypothetical protein
LKQHNDILRVRLALLLRENRAYTEKEGNQNAECHNSSLFAGRALSVTPRARNGTGTHSRHF